MDPTGNLPWKVSWEQFALGAAAATVFVGLAVMTGGASAVVLGELAATGAAGSFAAETIGATATMMGAMGGVQGLIDSQKTLEEIKTGKDANGNTIDATILPRKMGAYPIQVIASVIGIAAAGAGLTNAGGGGLSGELQPAEGPPLSSIASLLLSVN